MAEPEGYHAGVDACVQQPHRVAEDVGGDLLAAASSMLSRSASISRARYSLGLISVERWDSHPYLDDLLQVQPRGDRLSSCCAIPPKRFDRTLVSYLSEPEVDALLAACNQATPTGRRDHALLLLAVQTGLRVSVVKVKKSRPAKPGQLAQRLGETLPAGRRGEVELAEAGGRGHAPGPRPQLVGCDLAGGGRHTHRRALIARIAGSA